MHVSILYIRQILPLAFYKKQCILFAYMSKESLSQTSDKPNKNSQIGEKKPIKLSRKELHELIHNTEIIPDEWLPNECLETPSPTSSLTLPHIQPSK